MYKSSNKILKILLSVILCISVLSGMILPGVQAYADGETLSEEKLLDMTNTELIELYVNRMSPYYYEHYEKGDLKYFDSRLYLSNNSDVFVESIEEPDPGFFALEHYLNTGIFEGRSSCTSFDPAVAICVSRDAAVDTLLNTNSTPKYLERLFEEYTGLESTDGLYLMLVDGELYAFPNYEDDTVWQDYQDDGPLVRNPVYITARAAELSADFIPYTLYGDNSSSEIQTFDIGNGVKCTFYGNNYQQYKSTGKQYTMMIYMTGSDQEMKSGYVRVSSQLVNMLKTENLDNVNVLVCVGGSPDYKNSYMHNDISNIGTGIYYLNPNGLTQAQRDMLNSADSETLESSVKRNTALLDCINENTFVKLADIDSIDMGDPALLAGFMNFASRLYPAADYGLSLSNHGGGTLSGVCFSADSDDKSIKGTGLTIYELETALSSTDIFRLCGESGTSDGKLGLLFYDACLMAGTEQAYALKDYYRYMVASEEVTMSYTDYYPILKAINSAASASVDDRELAVKIMDAFKNTSWHGGGYGTDGTIAAFSSYDIEQTVIALSKVGSDFNALIVNAPDDVSTYTDDYNKIFNAFRKAIISCADFTGSATSQYSYYINNKDSLDIGEFLTYLGSNLKSISVSEQNSQLLNNLTDSIDAALNTGFLIQSSLQMDNGKEMVKSDTVAGNVISITDMKNNYADVWSKIRGNSGYYGASLVLPIPILSGSDNYLDKQQYTSDYEKSALKGYIEMINSYFNFSKIYLNSGNNGSQLSKLKGEIKPVRQGIKSVVKPDKNYSSNGIEYVVFNVAGSYSDTGIVAPEDSFGSPMQDIMETSSVIRLAIVDDRDSSSRYRNVYSVSNLNNESLSLDNNTINIDLTALNQNATSIYLTGTGGTSRYLNVSDYEYFSDDKKAIVSKFTSGGYISGYTLFEGELYYGTEGTTKSNTVIHVFSSAGYIGSVSKADFNEVWTSSQVDSVACYTYCIDTQDGYEYKNYNTDDSDFFTNDSSLRLNYAYLFRQSEGGGGLDMNDVALALSIDTDGLYYTELASINDSSVTPAAAQSAKNDTDEQEPEALESVDPVETLETSVQETLEQEIGTMESDNQAAYEGSSSESEPAADNDSACEPVEIIEISCEIEEAA